MPYLRHAFGDGLGRVGAAADEPLLHLLHRRRHDEYRAGAVAEYAFEVDSAHHVHVEYYHVALVPNAAHLASQGAVTRAVVYLLPLDELVRRRAGAEFILREEKIVDPVAFRASRRAGGGRNGKFQSGEYLQQPFHDGGFSRTARRGENHEFARLFHAATKYLIPVPLSSPARPSSSRRVSACSIRWPSTFSSVMSSFSM